jgi:hypothetical protein
MTGTCWRRSPSAAPRSWLSNSNGHTGIAAGKAAALATRKAKDHAEPEASFYARVASGLAEHGIGPGELEQVCRAAGPRPASSPLASGPGCWMRWPGPAG